MVAKRLFYVLCPALWNCTHHCLHVQKSPYIKEKYDKPYTTHGCLQCKKYVLPEDRPNKVRAEFRKNQRGPGLGCKNLQIAYCECTKHVLLMLWIEDVQTRQPAKFGFVSNLLGNHNKGKLKKTHVTHSGKQRRHCDKMYKLID